MADSPSQTDADLAPASASVSVSWLADSAWDVASGAKYQLTTTTSTAATVRSRVPGAAPTAATNPLVFAADAHADGDAAVAPSRSSTITNSVTVTRSLAETEALFAAIKSAHPGRCFTLLPPPLPTSVSAPPAPHLPTSRYNSLSPSSDASSLVALRACIESIVADRVLFADETVVRPFFFSVFKYEPPTSLSIFAITSSAASSPRSARRSSSPASAFALVFSKKPDDSDVFFSQVRQHLNALQTAAKDLCNRVDEYASKLIVLAFSMHELELRLAEMAKFETNETVSKQLRTLSSVINALEANVNAKSSYHMSCLRPGLLLFGGSIECMQLALDARMDLFGDFSDACKTVARRRQRLESLSVSSGSTSKKESVAQKLQEAYAAEAATRGAFMEVTRTVRAAYIPVRTGQAERLQALLNEYVQAQLQANAEILQAINEWAL
ncbi:hypothetical protein HDU82_008328 [Entophlyctis luteolus]|nr:hypothetical protein HDU82_008328 [Entophlyctis luteolus]KAJ3388812.1 hypothetical protein HDU84_009411 [Entophlyctis sp. JEL0112]